MFVMDKMSSSLVTVRGEYSISTALDIMTTNHLHRMPVVDQNGLLTGLLTRSIINKNTPTNATTLSVYELNHFLNKLKVSDVMISLKDCKTIRKEALLEEAALVMRQNDIGCLPVVEDGKVIGIITHNDIFDSFIDLLGYLTKGTRYTIKITDDKTGILADIGSVFAKMGINISSITVHNTPRGIEIVVIAPEDDASCTDALKDAGYEVVSVLKLNGK